MEIAKQGAQSLRMKMRNAELNLKETFAAACSKIALTSVKVPTGSTPSTGENIRASFQLITLSLDIICSPKLTTFLGLQFVLGKLFAS